MESRGYKIRFGVMIDGFTVQRWQLETLKLLTDNGIELAVVICNSENQTQKPSFFEKIRHYPYRKLLFRLWNRYWFKPESKAIVNLEIPKETPVMYCKPIIKGISTYFSENHIEEIKSYGLDFILRFGFDIVRGEILSSARYGIWSFHHDDERVVRGGPPGFWEFMRGIPENGVILQQLTDSLDKGLIIKRMNLNTTLHSYKEHLDKLYFESEILPLQVCNELTVGGDFHPQLSNSKAPIIHPPVNLQMMKYFWLCLWRRLKFNLDFLFRQEDWNVGYCMMPIDKFISHKNKELIDIQCFKPNKSEYFADPFVITTRKDTYIFFEWFSNVNGKSDLAVARKSENFERYHRISDFPEHRSYPFVIEHDNAIYCIPEAYKTGKVSLYRFDEDDLNLYHQCDLIEGQALTDPTLFNHDGKWFLFVTPQKNSHTHLNIYVADDIFGPYKEHCGNPVKVDCANSRPAGKIMNINGMLVRPAQNSTEHYGQSIALNKIVQISEYQYKEEYLEEISPITGATYDKGIHTINGDGSCTVIDAKRFVFTWRGFMQQMKVKLKMR